MKAKDKIGYKEILCPCGVVADFMCDCGCPCCGTDPCIFGCGGNVLDIQTQLDRGIKPRYE